MKSFIAVIAATTALTGSMAAAAVDVADIDLNGDSFVSEQELMVAYPDFDTNFFAGIDLNSDGRLSAEEMYENPAQDAIARATASNMTLMADANGDGFVTFEEITTAVPGFSQSNFDSIDTNSDNRIDAVEMFAPGAGVLIDQQTANLGKIQMETLDADGDSFLTYAELLTGFPNVPMVQFEATDANGDSRLSTTEYYAPDANTALYQY